MANGPCAVINAVAEPHSLRRALRAMKSPPAFALARSCADCELGRFPDRGSLGAGDLPVEANGGHLQTALSKFTLLHCRSPHQRSMAVSMASDSGAPLISITVKASFDVSQVFARQLDVGNG